MDALSNLMKEVFEEQMLVSLYNMAQQGTVDGKQQCKRILAGIR